MKERARGSRFISRYFPCFSSSVLFDAHYAAVISNALPKGRSWIMRRSCVRLGYSRCWADLTVSSVKRRSIFTMLMLLG